MANVREFNRLTSDELSCAVGALSGMTYGTYVLLVERLEVDVAHTIIAPHTAGGTGSGLRATWSQFNDTALVDGAGSPSNVAGLGAANVARILVWRKAPATATPRLSAYNASTAAWKHGNGHAAIGDGTAPGVDGTIRFGIGQFTGRGYFRIGAAAAWANLVKWPPDPDGDAAIEASGLDAYQAWINNSPSAAWRFSQDDTATAVVDDTGGGADQTALIGTTVVNDPAFDFFDFTLREKSTPASRTLSVPAESRVLAVRAESRTLVVPAESRTLEVVR